MSEPKKIYLTEQQLNEIIEKEMINESVRGLIDKVKAGAISVAVALAIIGGIEGLNKMEKARFEEEIIEAAPQDEWTPITNDCVVTVYNAVPSQCNADVRNTASMFRLDLKNPESHRIVAMERTMMAEYGLKYGDIVKIEGTYNGVQDGIYQIQDTMNKRFAGQHKIDVLVANNVHYGGTLKGKPATIYVLTDKSNTDKYKADMKPQVGKNNRVQI